MLLHAAIMLTVSPLLLHSDTKYILILMRYSWWDPSRLDASQLY